MSGLQNMMKAVTPSASFVVNFSAANYSIFDIGIPPGDARSVIELRADGTIWQSRLNQSNTQIGTWVTGSGFDANDFDFRIDEGGPDSLNYGPGDAEGAWVNGGGLILWGVEETGIGTTTCDGSTLSIRPAGGGGTIDTATCDLEAESTP